MPSSTAKLVLTSALLAAGAAQASVVMDAAGDFLSTYAGVAGGDLDVLKAMVTYKPGARTFLFEATMNGAIGTTASAAYVWGINRGAGAAAFAGFGLTDVLFDAVVVVNADGSARVTGTTPATVLPALSASIIGNSFSLEIAESLLPSRGFGVADYTWNLWPRVQSVAGFTGISDFAPDTTNAAVGVPEPASLALAGAALVGLGWARRRRV